MTITPEEENRLYNISIIPTAVVSYALIIVFILLTRGQPLPNLWFILTYFGIPFAFLSITTIFLSLEILYSRRTKQPIYSNIRRFFNRMIALIGGIGLFGGIVVLTYITLTPKIDDKGILLLATVIWFALWILLVFRFKGKLK